MGGMVSSGLELASLFVGQQQPRKTNQDQVQVDQVAAQNQYMAQQQAVHDKQQRDLMQRQLAVTRARLSANGGGVGAGSGQALLAGMVKDSENDIADSQALLQTRQANSGIGLTSRNEQSSGEGLLQGLKTVSKVWDIFGGASN